MINDSINRFLGVLCYPFVSMEIFQEDFISKYIAEIRSGDIRQAKQSRSHLKAQLVEYICRNYNVYSYDEIYLYLEKCFLGPAEEFEDGQQLYLHIMRKMASTLISHRDGRIVFKYWRNKGDEELFGGFAGNNKVTLFHSLNCHISMDVIAIIYMIENQKQQDAGCLDYFYGNIEVADQQLSRILESGVAENHLHKGVSRSFSSIWDSLMEPLTTEKAKSFWGREFVNGTKEQNKRAVFYILGCGIVRACLAMEIHGQGIAAVKEEEEIQNLVEAFSDGRKFEDFYVKEFQNRTEREITDFYVRKWEILEKHLPQEPYCDRLCMKIFVEDSNLHTLDENVFLYYALSDLIHHKENMGKRQKSTMQYLRFRNHLFHTSVQQKTIKGLDYFQQAHYSVNSALNHANIDNFWEKAIREQLQNQDLQKIEFRSSMPKSAKQFRKEVLDFLKAYQKILKEDYCIPNGEEHVPYRKLPQVGLVIHFLKRPDDSVPEKCVQNGKDDCSYLMFGRRQKEYEEQIEAFTCLRTEFMELSRYLVGIDAASLENSTPVWVFAPIYENARDSRIERIGRKSRISDYMQSLGFTFHAGEDFRHILSGLRRIDEAVEHLKFHAGDRIGHGIALGISPRKWKSQNPVIIIPQIEALENYLWAYDMLSVNYSNFQATILAYIEKRIYELAGRIYGEAQGDGEREGLGVEILAAGYQELFTEDKSQFTDNEKVGEIKKGLCEKLRHGEKVIWDARLLAAARHCKKFVKEMERPIHYEVTEQDILIVEELQKILKEKLGRKGIVIEVNPSSNTAIADLDGIEENQLYRLDGIMDSQNLIVCINSDDPAVFNTNVSNELAYIYYGMLEKDISREAALIWIDKIRRNGMNSSFIHHQETDMLLMKNLAALIQAM